LTISLISASILAVDRSPNSEHDAGLFEHDPGRTYMHLVREVLLTYRLFLRQTAVEFGVTGAQLEILRQLALADGRSTTSVLARELAVDPAAVTRVVAGLERLALVSREDDERDGRRRPVLLTPAGRAIVVDLHAGMHARESALTATIDEASIASAVRVLQTIRGVFDPGALRRPSRST
jgi:DNA-binding MarR family transcriptional regulator